MYSQKLAQVKNTVDQKTILAVLNANTENELRNLIQKYHIHIDVAEEIFSVLMLLCYGVISSEECFTSIKNAQAISVDDFVNFITEVNEKILEPIQDSLKKQVTDSATNPVTSYDNNLVNPSDQSIASELQDAEETAEEILARIDKEVEEEIDAEIEAELIEEARQKAEALAKQQESNAKMSSAQNIVSGSQYDKQVDIDLDEIPKTPVNTYNYDKTIPQQEPSVYNQDTKPKTSLDFIESVATGNIVSTTEAKPEDVNNIKTYMKDPYHEEL